MHLSNKIQILLPVFLLTIFLSACNEEDINEIAGVLRDGAPRTRNTDENMDTANDKSNEGSSKPDAVANQNCAMNWDYDTIHESGNVIHGTQLPDAESGGLDCRVQQVEIRFIEDGFESKARKNGESETTTELRVSKNGFSHKEGDSYAQWGGDWPDNEFSREFLRLLPKPDMPFDSMALNLGVKGSSILFSKDVTPNQMMDYAEQVKKRGFTIGAQTKDNPSLKFFSYEAKNREGYAVDITCIGSCVLGLKKVN